MFIDSQSLIGDGFYLDLAMVEARSLFQRAPRQVGVWRRLLASTSADPRDGSVFSIL
jgi:hypothetical protein